MILESLKSWVRRTGPEEFVDDEMDVTIKSYVERGQPLVLVPVYYNCPLLCNITLNRLIDTLKDMPYVPGEGYQILTFSIDPREGPGLAKKEKESHLKSLNRPGAGRGWHFCRQARETLLRQPLRLGLDIDTTKTRWNIFIEQASSGQNATSRVTQYYHGALSSTDYWPYQGW